MIAIKQYYFLCIIAFFITVSFHAQEELFESYKEAALKGDFKSINTLTNHFLTIQDYKKAHKWIKEGIKHNNPDSIASLGFLYFYGKGLEKNTEEAIQLYEKASQLGSSIGQYNLGNVFWYGLGGVEPNKDKTIQLYENSAKGNNPVAMYSLFCIYIEQGKYYNFNRAIILLKKAANQNYAVALNQLGFGYHYGTIFDKNIDTAIKYYNKAINLGDATSMSNLGLIYCNGNGVKQDYPKAKKLFEASSKKGNATAMVQLGIMYKDGLGVKTDHKKFLELLIKAKKLGQPDAIKYLKSIER